MPVQDPNDSRRSFLVGATALVMQAMTGCKASAPRHSMVPVHPSADSSLRLHAAEHRLLYGTAVAMHPLRTDAEYTRLIKEQCSILVPENCMKWAEIHPKPEQYNFEEADYLVAFAEKNHIKVRGHNLVWHKSLPVWLTSSISPEMARTMMTEHIQEVAGRYSNRMHSWDVVNEAIHLEDGRADGYRDSLWLKNIGPDYIEIAFQVARDADPAALLTYNEYGLDNESNEHEAKRQAVLQMLRRLKTRNIPIDALGLQAHLSTTHATYGEGLRRFLTSVRELGLQIFVTELDVNDEKMPADPGQRDLAVAKAVTDYLKVVLSERDVRAVLTWGISTRYSWLRTPQDPNPRGLPFDTQYQPTLFFNALRDSFDDRATQGLEPHSARTFVPLLPSTREKGGVE